jgi:hypothetical protein
VPGSRTTHNGAARYALASDEPLRGFLSLASSSASKVSSTLCRSSRATDHAYSLQATADNARCLRHERNDPWRPPRGTANPAHHGPCAAAGVSYIAHQRKFIILATVTAPRWAPDSLGRRFREHFKP